MSTTMQKVNNVVDTNDETTDNQDATNALENLMKKHDGRIANPNARVSPSQSDADELAKMADVLRDAQPEKGTLAYTEFTQDSFRKTRTEEFPTTTMPVDQKQLDFVRSHKQEAASISLQAMNPELFEVIDSRTYRMVQINNPMLSFDRTENDLMIMADENAKVTDRYGRKSMDLGIIKSEHAQEGHFVTMVCQPYVREEDSSYGCAVYMNLVRDGVPVRSLQIPAHISGKIDENGKAIPGNSVASVFFEGHEFAGDTADPETGYPVMIRYTASGIYLGRPARRWVEEIKEYVQKTSRSDMSYWEGSAILYALTKQLN